MEAYRDWGIKIYTVLVLAGLPLFFWNGYEDILQAKAVFFWFAAVSGGIFFAVYFFWWLLAGKNKKASVAAFFKGFNVLDICVAAFGIIAFISALSSEYRTESIVGNEAWYVGGGMILVCVLLYFFVSRGKGNDKTYVYAIFFAAVIVMIIGILNDLWIDPLGISEDVDYFWRNTFTSTIGNVNQFGAYLSIVIPFMSLAFVCVKKMVFKVFAACVLIPCYMALFLTHADGMYAGVGIGMLFVFFFSLRESKRYLSFLINGVMFGVAGYAVVLLLQIFPDTYLEAISPVLLANNVHLFVGAVSFVLILVHMFLELKVKRATLDKILRVFSWILLIAMAAGVVFAVVYVVKFYDETMLNNRGVLWKIALNVFSDFDTKEKLIGMGPATIDHGAVDYAFWIEEYYDYGKYYHIETAHNDVLEYLVTTGICGVASYIMIFLCVFASFIRGVFGKIRWGDERTVLFVGIMGYSAQALLYGPHPVTWAVLMILLSLFRRTQFAV